MAKPASSEKIDKWIDGHLVRIFTAIPFGTILIWGIPILFLVAMAFYFHPDLIAR